MNANGQKEDLLAQIAGRSWNPATSNVLTKEDLTSQVLMVFEQHEFVELNDASESVADIVQERLQTVVEAMIEGLAGYSLSLPDGSEAAVGFLVNVSADDDPPYHRALREGDQSLDGLVARTVSGITGHRDLRNGFGSDLSPGDVFRLGLITVVAFRNPDDIDPVGFELVEEALPNFDGMTSLYDPFSGGLLVQGWDRGDLDTGWLWAQREGVDPDDYEEDGAPFLKGLSWLLFDAATNSADAAT